MGMFTNIFDKIFNLSKPVPTEVVVTEPPKIQRKAPDRRQITTVAYDYIVDAHTAWVAHVAKFPGNQRPPITDLVNYLNTELCLDKSYRYYQRIWSGKKPRTDFIKPGFTPDIPEQREFDFGE